VVNLTSLSIRFGLKGNLREVFKFDISTLSELKSLRLDFSWQNDIETTGVGSANRFWLEDVFKEIGKRNKLEKLFLLFKGFYCDDFGRPFMVLGQSLKELTRLSKFPLRIPKAYSIGTQEMCILYRGIGKLKTIKELDLQLAQEYGLKSREFEILIDYIADGFPLLEGLALGFGKFGLTLQSCQHFCQAINRMKSLNYIGLKFFGEYGTNRYMKLLLDEVGKEILVEEIFNLFHR